jgi:phage/plasmid-associated DNA primase
MKELYDSYKSWCENSSFEAMQSTCFGKELTRRGFKILKERAGNARLGIRLKPAAADLRVA